MDLFRFFPSVRARRVRSLFLEEPFNFDLNLASALALLCTYRHSLPTGSPVSPVISNLVCLEMDATRASLVECMGFSHNSKLVICVTNRVLSIRGLT
jgi:hypothetical protein